MRFTTPCNKQFCYSFIRYLLFTLLFGAFLISLDHLFALHFFSPFSSYWLGLYGWVVFLGTLVFLSRKFIISGLLVFFIFASFGFVTGPFLEPPADSLDHLRVSRKMHEKDSSEIARYDNGLWHYSMNNVVLYSGTMDQIIPEKVLRKINFLHGVYCGALALALFILSQSAGLPPHWGFLSVLICFLFFGTNRFSFFGYYSFGPSFTSMAIYWLWTACFFFRRKMTDVFCGLFVGGLVLPILWVNHYQEAAFLGIIILIHLLINTRKWVWETTFHAKTLLKVIYGIIVLFFLVGLPQLSIFHDIVDQIIPGNYWNQNSQRLCIKWHDLHLIGKFWSNDRVGDTLGIVGYSPLLVAILLLWLVRKLDLEKKYLRVIIPGIIPFIGYCIPLLHFSWVATVYYNVYYRLVYASMFWLTIVFFLYVLERYIPFKRLYYIMCVAAVVMLSTVRSAPVYGKLDFLLVDSKSWLKEWRPLLLSVLENEGEPIYTDYMTTSILYDVFGKPVNNAILDNLAYMDYPLLDVSNMESAATETKYASISPGDLKFIVSDKTFEKKYRCIINLHGFDPTWVPAETRHWSPRLADTSRYYEFQGKRGIELREYLQKYPERDCEIFY